MQYQRSPLSRHQMQYQRSPLDEHQMHLTKMRKARGEIDKICQKYIYIKWIYVNLTLD